MHKSFHFENSLEEENSLFLILKDFRLRGNEKYPFFNEKRRLFLLR